jgi:3-methyl-2-oxobutanoate hydroxymethyltransferase
LADALALEQAGVYAIVLEAMPAAVAARVTRAVRVPTIGIGSGKECDGQVLVCTDLLGMSRGRVPRFVKRYAELGDDIVRATRAFADEVRSGAFPGPEHSYDPVLEPASPRPVSH